MRIIPFTLSVSLFVCTLQWSDVSTHAAPAQPSQFSRRFPMNQLAKRADIPVEQRWKLEDLFPNQQAWDNEYQKTKDSLKKANDFQGTLHEAAAIKACFAFEDEISLHTERLYVYANMKHHEDTAEDEFQGLSEKSKKLSVEVSEALSFITPEILSLSDAQLDALVNKPELSAYKRTLEEMKRQKAHVLSKAEEALLAQVGNIAQALSLIHI